MSDTREGPEKVEKEEPAPTGVTLFELREGQCKFPISGTFDTSYRFCGAPAVGHVYCQHHRHMVYLWTIPAPQGFSHRSGNSSVQLSIRPYGALPRALMRSADRRPIMLASTKLDRPNGLCRPRSDRLPSLCRMPSQTNRVPPYTGTRHSSPLAMIAQTIRAVLLASATVTTLNGRRSSSSAIQAFVT
jgi:hypothetical protein